MTTEDHTGMPNENPEVLEISANRCYKSPAKSSTFKFTYALIFLKKKNKIKFQFSIIRESKNQVYITLF